MSVDAAWSRPPEEQAPRVSRGSRASRRACPACAWFLLDGPGPLRPSRPSPRSCPMPRSASVAAQRVVGRHLHEHDRQPVGVLDPHLDQPPRLLPRRADDRDTRRRQPRLLGGDVPDLEPEGEPRGGGSPACPDTSSGPCPGSTRRRGAPAARTPGTRPDRGLRRRKRASVRGPSGAAGPGCFSTSMPAILARPRTRRGPRGRRATVGAVTRRSPPAPTSRPTSRSATPSSWCPTWAAGRSGPPRARCRRRRSPAAPASSRSATAS